MPRFFGFVRDQYTALPMPPVPADITLQTFVVTGANTGLGFQCAQHLLSMGAARVILGVRSVQKGEAALAAMRQETGRHDAGEVWELDLQSLNSVESFGRRLDTLDRLDALIANAGVVMTSRQIVQGIELSLLVNVVSTMLLAFRTLPKLLESARNLKTTPHLVIVSSNSALESSMKDAMSTACGDVFDKFSEEKEFGTFTQYPKTKLLQIYAMRQLASLLPIATTGVVINAVSPGLCYTDLDRNASRPARLVLAAMRMLLARTAEEGSRTLLHAALAGPDSHGAYCSECRVKNDDVPAWITNSSGKITQERVWEDLLKRLDSMGHGVDVAALTAPRAAV
ncbi:short chain dehydrogenase/reductase family oxidoreductase [Sporothrix brasiliensis 5110]|uniref:Short chain dehydrogenase/reductase family oxidoreductase n=1 Tax=Sporothrix brasiliensis 5110 TaxID=1398154 RepID=A0A0C2F3U3_9PEZI|nr:short chain dehydrogenase/reductase family oxidoreductase [Sporothrix brasiliensis 5110]KIH93589.1 short chain dehydrogenase/reductase family oxidoreductase [Sporothrix brasiliensis 5110]